MEGVVQTQGRPLGLHHVAKAATVGTLIFLATLGAAFLMTKRVGIDLSNVRHFGVATLAQGLGLSAGILYLLYATAIPRKPTKSETTKPKDHIHPDDRPLAQELQSLIDGESSNYWEIIDLQADDPPR